MESESLARAVILSPVLKVILPVTSINTLTYCLFSVLWQIKRKQERDESDKVKCCNGRSLDKIVCV